jgi:precorrin-6Y C5,15-methyltransferase (decarboxylating)
MNPVNIIGMGMGPQDLSEQQLKIIEQADVLVGGRRLLEFFKASTAQKKSISKDIENVIDYVKNQMKTHNVVVLASGDPLFFGIGATLTKALGSENVLIYPNISTVSAAFARIKEPWSDVQIISLHGKKNEKQLLQALEKEDNIAVLTDPRKNPAWLARLLIEKHILDFKICVLEKLGSSSERIDWYTLSQAAAMEFAAPNLAVLKRGAKDLKISSQPHLGMPDGWFAHQAGLITKSEVRAVSLSRLQLLPNHTMWDLGAGSGAVSIEASVLIANGHIYAVEKNPKRIEQIKRNKQRFKVKNLDIIESVLPQGLTDLPAPDRVFIGGGGKELKIIIQAAAAALKSNGIIVINTVLLSSLQVAKKTMKQLGFQTDVVQIQINRGSDMPWGERLEAQNPVWIVTGMRNSDCGMRKEL